MPAVILSSRSISDGTRSGSFIVVVDRTTLPVPDAAARRRNAALVQRFGNHKSRHTTMLYDRTSDEITLEEIERIMT